MRSGTVKWFNPKKGFGFISCDGKDIFVHIKGVQNSKDGCLYEGQKVTFDVEMGKKGEMAANVVIS